MPSASVSVNGTVIAQSSDTVVVEGNHYFPPQSLKEGILGDSNTQYTCGWKGDAKYYNGTVDGKQIKDIAWSYPNPKPAAQNIAGYLAFDKAKTTIQV
ncbi:DUF427-domain-containing protein [Sistotremastrum niveocremeum HHB9708]|uniref:DUF427-domain-containing protein n=2 Tax=Sistotremastraceae TaxID=3402574 RepID=A0A164RFX9_9AGAM|nr:DUF427-domain-containing protein [Sistotremastrum niveocremeum HHB9708]KZT40645.1 DUF427-domain-containing protein [Sistotremastrum suecicum HHB10207 ss-3]